MPIERIFDGNYESFIKNSEKVVLVIGRQDCVDCEAYNIIIKAISKKADKIRNNLCFGNVELDDPSLQTVQIHSDHKGDIECVPHTVLYKNGNKIGYFRNIRDNTFVKDRIKEYLGVTI